VKVKMILPALVEARDLKRRPIKYSLFPPLGLATLAAYLDPDDSVSLQDEHVERIDLDDEPDLVVIQIYVTSAKRAYAVADHYRNRGAHVCLGGLHASTCPEEAAAHADTLFLGPGEDIWPVFLRDFRAGNAGALYRSKVRSLAGLPLPRRDLIRRERYLVPNSLVVSRGCPHHCDFCYKDSFFKGGRSYYTLDVERALLEIASLPGRHLYFLDDHLFGNGPFAQNLFDGMRGMGRIWQAAGTVKTILERPHLYESAAACGLRSLFVGFENLENGNLASVHKSHNLGLDYEAAVRRLRDMGVMVNASFVYGFDGDGPDVFDRTVDWAVRSGLETATFHILTPYPGTALRQALERGGRILTNDWDLYDTRHAVYRPARLTLRELEEGYWRSYDRFYSWPNILKSSLTKLGWKEAMRHLAYAGGWKKLEPMWNLLIASGLVGRMRPVLETVLESRSSGEPRVECAGGNPELAAALAPRSGG
jgi:radical SAM superfamily enzyme YgiQ (UPF0313 family)